jgi:aryl-alcohol dehydrogenase-like predicted oxidoreductase
LSVAHLHENVAAADLVLPGAAVKELDTISPVDPGETATLG